MTTYTYSEISKQPETWEKTYAQILDNKDEILNKIKNFGPDEVIFSGCGTSYYISISAAYTFAELTGVSSKAVPASELFLAPNAVLPQNKKILVFAISRSGTTSEIIKAVDFLQKNQLAECIALTGYPESQLAKTSNYSIVLPHIQEKSVVMTGSFTNLLLTTQLISGLFSGNANYLEELKSLPEKAKAIWNETEQLAKIVGENLDYKAFVYLGLGGNLGLAYEGMLKMKEMTQAPSEAYNPLEFRHGPISIVTNDFLVVQIASHSISKFEQAIVKDIQRVNGTVLTVGNELDQYASDYKLDLKANMTDSAKSILSLPFLQLCAYYRTHALNLNPDQPRNLNQVVVLEG